MNTGSPAADDHHGFVDILQERFRVFRPLSPDCAHADIVFRQFLSIFFIRRHRPGHMFTQDNPLNHYWSTELEFRRFFAE